MGPTDHICWGRDDDNISRRPLATIARHRAYYAFQYPGALDIAGLFVAAGADFTLAAEDELTDDGRVGRTILDITREYLATHGDQCTECIQQPGMLWSHAMGQFTPCPWCCKVPERKKQMEKFIAYVEGVTGD